MRPALTSKLTERCNSIPICCEIECNPRFWAPKRSGLGWAPPAASDYCQAAELRHRFWAES